MRLSTIICVILLIAGAFGVYMMKMHVQNLKSEVAITEKKLREEKKHLHVLNAEWAFLNRPDRLKQLSAKYLNVKPMVGKQLVNFAALPKLQAPTAVEQAKIGTNITPVSNKIEQDPGDINDE